MQQHDAIRRGTVTELLVASHLTSIGCSVSLPISHNQDYDMIADGGQFVVSRIQVKRCFRSDSSSGYRIDMAHGKGGKTYTKNSFDYLATITPDNKWIYIIPIQEVQNKYKLRVYGDDTIPYQQKTTFEKYRYKFSTE